MLVFWKIFYMMMRCKKLHNDAKNYKGEPKVNIKPNNKLATKYVALIAIFSALYAILRYIPLGPMIGMPANFSFSDALAPLLGIILGPFAGGVTVIIGTFAAAALGKPLVFLGLDFLPALVNCVAVGLLMKRKWIPVAALYILLIGLFVISPYSLALVQVGSLAIPFVWLHVIALILLISPLRSKAVDNVKKTNIPRLTVSLAVLVFIGTMLQHLTGNLLFQLILGPPVGNWTVSQFAAVWNVAFYAYPVERMLMTLIAVLIGVPLIIAIKKSLLPFETPMNEQEKTKKALV